jgi:hypothetical protein
MGNPALSGDASVAPEAMGAGFSQKILSLKFEKSSFIPEPPRAYCVHLLKK